MVLGIREHAADPLIGSVLGSFRIERRLGRGGMGTVYLGRHVVIGSKVAVKVLHRELAADPDLVQRFYSEARAVNLIGHENIVSIFDVNVMASNLHYLVMEYLEGQPLSTLARSPIAPATAINILAQACAGLHAAHKHGVVHRDLKPDNIFLTRKAGGQGWFVKILDFGVAKLLERGNHTAYGVMLGTPSFMAPEQWTDSQVDARSDVYALGINAYLLATGRVPFTGKTLAEVLKAHRDVVPPAPHAVNSSVPRSFSDAIMRAIAKRPEDRFQTAGDFGMLLLEILEKLAEETPNLIFTPPPIRPLTIIQPSPLKAKAPQATVTSLSGQVMARVPFTHLMSGGVFLCWHDGAPPPPLFSRLQVTLNEPQDPLTLACEVVRQVSPADAERWGMPPGIGVQFVNLDLATKQRLLKLIDATSRAPEAAPETRKERVRPPEGTRSPVPVTDYYRVLGISEDADPTEVRRAGREALAQVEAMPLEGLSAAQLQEREQRIARVRQARAVLEFPAQRAEYDASRGNFQGVARCLAAGLRPAQLEELRQRYVATRRETVAQAQTHIEAAAELEREGDFPALVKAYERALALDPLNLFLHQRYELAQQKTMERLTTLVMRQPMPA